MRWYPLVLVALLVGCASHEAQEVRIWAAGRSIAELEQCAGKPSATDTLPDGSAIAQWDYTEPSTNTSLPVPVTFLADLTAFIYAPVLAPFAGIGTISTQWTSSGSCRAIATVRDGRVLQLRYSGPNGGFSGPDAVCAPIMRECLRT